MKTFKLLPVIVLFSFLSIGALNGQTCHYELRSSVEGIEAWCLERPISGEFVYNFTYHLNPKTGKVDRIHWCTSKSEVWDTETGEKYKVIDVGQDNGGSQWEFWNNINDYVENQYNVVNGWLPLPDNYQIDGSFIGMNFKFIGKGGVKVSMKFMWQLHVKPNGDISVDKYVEVADCN